MRWFLALLLVAVLGGCAQAEPAEVVPLDTIAEDLFEGAAGVHSVKALLEITPVDKDEDPVPPIFTLDVVMVADVTGEQLMDVAADVRVFATSHENDAEITAVVTVEPLDHDGDADTSPIIPLALDIYPNLRTNATEDARQLIAAHGLPGVQQVSIDGNRVHVQVATAAEIAGVLDDLRQLDLWSSGGQISADLGRVRISDVPERLTTDGMRVILETAVAYPTAQFWLEAPNDGRQVQALYVDQASEEEAAAIASILGDPTLPTVTVGDIEVAFVVSWIDGDGRHDLTGVLGERLDTTP